MAVSGEEQRYVAIGKRWCGVALLAVVAAAVTTSLAWLVADWVVKRTDQIAWPALLAVDVVLVALLVSLGRMGFLGQWGWRRAWSNPPPWLVAVGASGLVILLWRVLPTSTPDSLRGLASDEAIGLVALLPSITLALVDIFAEPLVPVSLSTPRAGTSSRELDTYDAIVAWAKSDDPIDSENSDTFGHGPVVRRIADRLGGDWRGSEMTIALLGEKGAGKTSILGCVRTELRRRGKLDNEVLLVSLSLWPYESADAAIRGVLGAIEKGFGEQTSTVSIAHSARHYLAAVEKVDSRLGALGAFVARELTPAEALQGYDELAQLIGVRVVVWIEDLERFSPHDEKDVAPLRALLYQLQTLEWLCVVIATDDLQKTLVDPAKVARYVERIPKLDLELTWSLLHRFHAGVPEAPADSSFRVGWRNPYMSDEENRRQVPASLVHLCRTPRVLKQVLRTVSDSWSRLRGEILFDDLIYVSVVRLALPEVFSVLERHIDQWRRGSSDATETRPVVADAELFRLTVPSYEASDDGVAVLALLCAMFPHRGRTPRPRRFQGVASVWPRDYWSRCLADDVALEHESDVVMLRAVEAAREGQFRLLCDAFADPRSSGAAEYFVELLPNESLPGLLDALLTDREKESPRQWPAAFLGAQPPGLVAVWRVIKHRRVHMQDDLSAAADVIEARAHELVRTNVPLCRHVLYWFVDAGAPKNDVALDDSAFGVERGRRLGELMHRGLLQFVGHPEHLISALKGESRAELAWMVREGRLNQQDEAPWFEHPIAYWESLARTILDATEMAPIVMGGNLLDFFVRTRNEARVPDYLFNASAAVLLFPDSARLRRALDAVNSVRDELGQEARAALDAALTGLREQPASPETPAA